MDIQDSIMESTESFSFQNGTLHFHEQGWRDVITQLYASRSVHTVPPSNVLEEWWLYLVQTIGDLNMLIVAYSLMNVCYLLGSLVFCAIDKLHLLDKYKIQYGKYPNAADYKKCIKNILTNYVVIIYPLIYFSYPLLNLIGFQMALPLPDLFTFTWHMAFCILIEDVAHYWLHRALHIPVLYKAIHKVHHTFSTPFGLTASYAHWSEILILGIPTFLGAAILRSHYFTFFCFIIFRQMDAVMTHSGYDLPHPFDFLPFFGGTVPHDFHHKSFIFNYSSRFTFMDKWCGTWKEPPVVMSSKEKKLIE